MRTALNMSKTTPVPEISVMLISQELGVSAPAVHYHVDGRDGLTSNIINAFYAEVFRALDMSARPWRDWVAGFSGTLFNQLLIYKGVSVYLMTQNRHRIVQRVQPNERDFGKAVFELLMTRLSESGQPAGRRALYVHLILQHVMGTAHATVARMLPADNIDYLVEHFTRESAGLSRAEVEAFAHANSSQAFEEGLRLLLDGLETPSTSLTSSLH